MDPKHMDILAPRACKYVVSHGQRDFADVVKLKTLKWVGYPGLSGWVLNVVTGILIREQRCKDGSREREKMLCYWL